MAQNPLFSPNVSPTNTTRPTKAVNNVDVSVKRTHNTFDNSYFNFKTQRFGQYEPFWWKSCVAGDNEPYSNSHNVRSLPFASPILSPMKLNKDYFQVPHYAIQPNTWDYIFKSPSQGDDVPRDAQNLFPLFRIDSFDGNYLSLASILEAEIPEDTPALTLFLRLLYLENFLSSGSLLYQLGYKINPVILLDGEPYSFDELFDKFVSFCDFTCIVNIPNSDSESGLLRCLYYTGSSPYADISDIDHDLEYKVDKFTFVSLCRHYLNLVDHIFVADTTNYFDASSISVSGIPQPQFVPDPDSFLSSAQDGINCIRMDVINAYQLACAQFYVNPRVDFIYNAQLYRDNWISLLRNFMLLDAGYNFQLSSFEYNGIPVLYDYFSYRYYNSFVSRAYGYMTRYLAAQGNQLRGMLQSIYIVQYLFGFREQLRFGDYFSDSRTQALGYGEPGSDVVNVMDDSVSVTDLSQKLVLNRFRTAVAHLDNTSEDYLRTMFGENLPPDYHYPKFIVHSEFGVNGSEVSNTTSDDQGNIVTNLMSGQDSAEFNIDVSVPSILIGISYISVPRVYSQVKERAYMHEDRYDMFQPMLQYFGDQEIYNREKSDYLPNPSDAYGYVSRNGEYKQRVSQCSGAFLTSLRSWIFVSDPVLGEGVEIIPSYNQSDIAIRAHDFEFNRFLKAQPGVSLGSGFHFIMQYNNKNVDNRPMEINPLPLYPNSKL